MGDRMVFVRQIRSGARHRRSQRETLQCLGLGRIGRAVIQPATPSVIGMIKTVAHLVEAREATEAMLSE